MFLLNVVFADWIFANVSTRGGIVTHYQAGVGMLSLIVEGFTNHVHEPWYVKAPGIQVHVLKHTTSLCNVLGCTLCKSHETSYRTQNKKHFCQWMSMEINSYKKHTWDVLGVLLLYLPWSVRLPVASVLVHSNKTWKSRELGQSGTHLERESKHNHSCPFPDNLNLCNANSLQHTNNMTVVPFLGYLTLLAVMV